MEEFQDDAARYMNRTSILHGANWFYWLAILSAINSFVVFYFQMPNTPLALGVTQWLDGTHSALNSQGTGGILTVTGLVIDLLIAAVLAGFGYLARRGSDLAFVIGIFLYVVDAMLSIGMRDFFGFGVHLIGLFFLCKGLLASRHVRENAISI